MYHDCPIISENDDSRDQIFSSVSFAFVKIDSRFLFIFIIPNIDNIKEHNQREHKENNKKVLCKSNPVIEKGKMLETEAI